jgi:hypothetical protein
MATNLKRRDGLHLSLATTDPVTPASGDPVRIGNMTGVAQTAKGDGGNAAANTSVDLGPSVWNLSVRGVNDGGNSAVAVGDALFYVDADTPKISKKASGYFFGIALDTVGSGATATVQVLHMPTAASPLGAGSVSQTNLAANSLDGTVAANVADSNVIGGIPVLHRIPVPAGVTGNVDVTLTHKERVVDAWLVKSNAAGGGAGTIQVKNAAAAISDAMSINVADQTVVRAATIDDAAHEIAAAGTLRIARTRSASTDETCIVYVLCVRIA